VLDVAKSDAEGRSRADPLPREERGGRRADPGQEERPPVLLEKPRPTRYGLICVTIGHGEEGRQKLGTRIPVDVKAKTGRRGTKAGKGHAKSFGGE